MLLVGDNCTRPHAVVTGQSACCMKKTEWRWIISVSLQETTLVFQNESSVSRDMEVLSPQNQSSDGEWFVFFWYNFVLLLVMRRIERRRAQAFQLSFRILVYKTSLILNAPYFNGFSLVDLHRLLWFHIFILWVQISHFNLVARFATKLARCLTINTTDAKARERSGFVAVNYSFQTSRICLGFIRDPNAV